MLRTHVLIFVLVAWICGEVASAYLKNWEEGEERAPSPYEQAMLKRLQTYLDAAEERQRGLADPELPAKRQMRYNQCYFNPISCFKRRK